MPDPVGIKSNMENLRQNIGNAKRRYEEARHQVGAPQGGMSENMEQLPPHGSSVEKTRVRINLWAANHEEKWRRVPTKSEEEIQENNKTVKKGLHRPMVMDGGEGKKLKKCCVVDNIEHQQKIRESDEIRGNE